MRHLGQQSDDDIADRLRDAWQALLIVDNRRQARGLFDRIRDVEGAAPLSTLMTPDYRRHALAEVRARLVTGAPVRLLATSLVEAGVDADFWLVMRAETGLDRIAQAAGQCNREGRMATLGEMLVFKPEHTPHRFWVARLLRPTTSSPPMRRAGMGERWHGSWASTVPLRPIVWRAVRTVTYTVTRCACCGKTTVGSR